MDNGLPGLTGQGHRRHAACHVIGQPAGVLSFSGSGNLLRLKSEPSCSCGKQARARARRDSHCLPCLQLQSCTCWPQCLSLLSGAPQFPSRIDVLAPDAALAQKPRQLLGVGELVSADRVVSVRATRARGLQTGTTSPLTLGAACGSSYVVVVVAMHVVLSRQPKCKLLVINTVELAVSLLIHHSCYQALQV